MVSVRLVRYAVLALFALVAARSLYRLVARSIHAVLFVNAMSKLATAGNFLRAAKLMSATRESTAGRLMARALSLRIPALGPPSGAQEHFRDGGDPGESFETSWKRAMDSAQQALRMEVLTDTVAGSVAAAITAAIAIFGVTRDPLSAWRNAHITIFVVALFAVLAVIRTGASTLNGLVVVRRFCESIKVPVEQMDASRLEAAKLAEGVWLRAERHSGGEGTDP